ncbi:hypothetical protein PTSG_08593 [Salpingoeca rosetta]|uniref:CCHC-type domain-containing protein n=1 Tax=Salpingoeca rosetta (strain ATCC 50818 / BSB-021) TaxID=946362 RepID=F2UK48_SALR5|nr:uncharacterized protein PTSG_08593 [Salpingoeca rosetta]EGD77497.1 hypothetical protein PTSG_08593 [Salpingoeca rosetta]|eukprot:XP_004990385.1 hypothetical protein PTSG_08593 [Salpingoeca rosetta]
MSGTSLQEYARAFDGRAAELMDGVDASESYFTFFEKAMKLQASFAADLEALCSSRHAHTARLFNSTPAEHNPELAAAWSETVDALRTIAQAHKQCSKVMHDQVCRPILQMRTTLEPQLKSSLSLGRKVIQECRTSHSKVKQEEKKFHRAAAAAATETDDLKKQRLEQDQTGREMVYRDALASHEQRTRQATTVALPGLYNELAQMEWRRIRTVATATTTALQAMQASARVLCDDAEDNRVNRAVSRMKEISEDCVHVDVDVQVEPAPSFEPVTQEMIETNTISSLGDKDEEPPQIQGMLGSSRPRSYDRSMGDLLKDYGELAKAGGKTTEKTVLQHALSKLPMEYAYIAGTFTLKEGDRDRTLADLYFTLLREEERQRTSNTSSRKEGSERLAKATTARYEKRKQKGYIKCYYCGKKGHIKRDCRKKKRDEQGQRRRIDKLCTLRHHKPHTEAWLVDSGATRHITSNREDLDEVRPDNTPLTLANGETTTAIGTGNAALTTEVGKIVLQRDDNSKVLAAMLKSLETMTNADPSATAPIADKPDPPAFSTNDRVLLYTPRVKPGTTTKLARLWRGPYVVTRKLSQWNYGIIPEAGGPAQVVHVARLKAYTAQDDTTPADALDEDVDADVLLD